MHSEATGISALSLPETSITRNTTQSANAAVESDDEGEAAFFAALEVNELPELLSNYKSDTDNGDDGVYDRFSEIATNSDSDYVAEESLGTDESNADLLISDDSNYIAMNMEGVHTVCIKDDHTSENIPCIEVYDSICTRHICVRNTLILRWSQENLNQIYNQWRSK